MHPRRGPGDAAVALLAAALALSGVLPAQPPAVGHGDLADVPWAGGAIAPWTRTAIAAGADQLDTPEVRAQPTALRRRPQPREACCSSPGLPAGVATVPSGGPQTATVPLTARGVRMVAAAYLGPTAPQGDGTWGLTATGGSATPTTLARTAQASPVSASTVSASTVSASTTAPGPAAPASSGSGPGATGVATPALPTAEAFSFTPNPLAAAGALSPGQTVVVAVYAAGGSGSPVPGALVYLSFVAAPGGGSAAVGGTLLGAVPQAFVADATGTVTVTYTAPAALPAGGTDILTAANGDGAPTASGTDSYRFVPPTATTAPGSGGNTLQVVAGADGGLGLVVALPDGQTADYPLAPHVTVTQDGGSAALEDLVPGDALVLTLNGQDQVTAIEVAPANSGTAGGGSSSTQGLSSQGASREGSSSQGS